MQSVIHGWGIIPFYAAGVVCEYIRDVVVIVTD